MLSAGSRIQIPACPNMSSSTGSERHSAIKHVFAISVVVTNPLNVVVFQTGEGVKDARKGICANHVSAMSNFLKVV